jgi:hypothetical protein
MRIMRVTLRQLGPSAPRSDDHEELIEAETQPIRASAGRRSPPDR